MTHPLILLSDGIEDLLKKTSAVGVYTGDRIFEYQTTGYTLDCVEYRHTAGGNTNLSPREAFDVTYEVYAVSSDRKRARKIADAIRDAMLSGGVRMPGWDVYDIDETNWITRKFYAEGNQYWAIGQGYDIRAAKRS